jgi:hypothetical protein
MSSDARRPQIVCRQPDLAGDSTSLPTCAVRARQKYFTFYFFAIASAQKKVILWVIVPRQQEALIMFDSHKLSANDEEDMEDFQDYDDEEHPDLTSKLDEFDDEDEDDEEEEIVVVAVEVPPPAPAPRTAAGKPLRPKRPRNRLRRPPRRLPRKPAQPAAKKAAVKGAGQARG